MGNSSGVPEDRTASPAEFRDRYAQSLIAAVTHHDLPQGVCHGMCLDWIRLILNGQVRLFKEYVTKEGVPRQILDQHERMHYLFHSSMRSVESEVRSDVERLLQMNRTGGQAEKLHARNALRELQMQVSDRDHTYSLFFERFREDFRKQFVSYITFDQIRVDTLTPSYLGDPAKALGDFFAAIRTSIELLPVHCCALLLMTGPKSGHFIAFFRNPSRYFMFDPNFGWYLSGDVDQTWDMFKDLWYAAYRKSEYNEVRWRIFRSD